VVKDSVATHSLPQTDRLIKFLQRLVAKASMGSEQSSLFDARFGSSQSVYTQDDSSWLGGGSRAVKGQHIVSTNVKTTAGKKSTSVIPAAKPKPPASPFSSAFFDNNEPVEFTSAKPSPREPVAKQNTSKRSKTPLSFEDAFLEQDKPSRTENLNPNTTDNGYDFDEETHTAANSTTWTKQRVKGLEKTIKDLAPEVGSNGGKINLTKDMLASAEVIAQVEEKFIIVKANGVLLCVDQHAADERVALEKLENALLNQNLHDDMVIHMTKKSIKVSDIIKPTKLVPPKRISLSQKDRATVKHHWSLLVEWKFTFDEADDNKSLLLTGLPSICNRVAGTNDFLEFVKELGHLTGGQMAPPFVKTVLASNACRYAIMFGDSLTHEQCVELISSLSKCNFSFICAHGRPSIIPLIDMKQDGKSSYSKPEAKYGNGADDTTKHDESRFGPKRLIRR